MSSFHNVVDVGTPPGPLSEWLTTQIRFHRFNGLKTTRNHKVKSPEFTCFGHQWSVSLRPGGHNRSSEGFVSLTLKNRTKKRIDIEFNFVVRGPNSNSIYDIIHRGGTIDSFAPHGTSTSDDGRVSSSWGVDFAERRRIIKYNLIKDTMIVEVQMRTAMKSEDTSFISYNPCSDNVLGAFNEEETADIVFEVSGELGTEKDRRKRAKLSTVTFHAHHFILRSNATPLADMCQLGDSTPVQITNISPEVFKHMLYYCYGGTISEENLKSNAKEIINAADRFGIVNLKLQAESCYVKENELTVANILDNLLYADSKNLALLQEKVMDFVAENNDNVLDEVSFDDVPGSIVPDLLAAVSRTTGGNTDSKDDRKFMRVNELRKRLQEKGLNVDGSRKTMIALLKENDNEGQSS